MHCTELGAGASCANLKWPDPNHRRTDEEMGKAQLGHYFLVDRTLVQRHA